MGNKKPQHTPGPWGVYVNTSRECYDIFKPTEGLDTPNKVVAFVPYPPVGNNEEANNNARLIAAAPELLERLKGCANAFHIAMMVSQNTCGHNDDFERCKQVTCKHSRTLIAKAEGRGDL